MPAGGKVRPTADRVREALFDILGPTLDGARVLDVFAGSGALGLEALSRGARSVTFLERDPKILAVIRRNVLDLGVQERCVLLAGPTEWLARRPIPGSPFDLVLADPPYDDPVRVRFLHDLASSEVLAASARVVVERDHRAGAIAEGLGPLILERRTRYGRTCLDFYRWKGVEPRGAGPATGKIAGSEPG